MQYELIATWGHFDIPLNGIIQTDVSQLAFEASVMDDDPPDELAHIPGVYSRLRAFECPAGLQRALEELERTFREWKRAYDKKWASVATHPLAVNGRYQELARLVEGMFRQLGNPILEAIGFMHIDAQGKWTFIVHERLL